MAEKIKNVTLNTSETFVERKGEQVHKSVGTIALLNLPIEIIIGIVLWMQIKHVPERAIADLPSSIHS